LLLRSICRIKPSDAEVSANPRARSAVLRVAERTEVPWSEKLAGVEPESRKGGGGKGKPRKGGRA